jgi:hypothetical protein
LQTGEYTDKNKKKKRNYSSKKKKQRRRQKRKGANETNYEINKQENEQ